MLGKKSGCSFAVMFLLSTAVLFAAELPIGDAIAWVVNGKLSKDSPLIAVCKLPPATYTVQGFSESEEPVVYVITIRSGDIPTPVPIPPNPTPVPNPRLIGFALEVYQQAKLLPASDCVRMASNYETVASAIAAGGIRDVETARVKITELNRSLALSPAVWTGFAQWLGERYTRDAGALGSLKDMMGKTAEGLRAVGGGS